MSIELLGPGVTQLVIAKAMSEAYSIAVKISVGEQGLFRTNKSELVSQRVRLCGYYKEAAAGGLAQKRLRQRQVQFASNEGNISSATKTLGLAAA